jgi:aromatic-L-amino-acid decarboxylase
VESTRGAEALEERPDPLGRYPLEPSADQMRSMGEAALAYLIDFIRDLPAAPAAEAHGALELAGRLREPAPEEGRPLEAILPTIEAGAAKAFNTAGPGYLAFIPGGGLFSAALASFVAAGVNRYVALWSPAPAFAQIEWTVIRWLCDIFDYPDGARGILTSGGSMSNFSAIVTARRARLPEDFLRGTLYVSGQVHASVVKAAVLAGFPARSVRQVPCTPDLRMDAGALREMLERDRGQGFQPFCLVASAGTTNTGAIDPLDDLAGLGRDEGLWLHVDAAYGGFFQLTERGRGLFHGIEKADSITLDPHKGMFLPYGTGCLLVRDGRLLREAHHVQAEYLQDLAPEGEIPNFAEYSPELSRDFRGLRVWLPVKLHGLAAFRTALDEKLDLARHLYDELKATPGFELPWVPELTVVPFRLESGRGDREELNRLLLERINASKRVFLSSTMIDGRFILRACIVSHRTHRDRIDEAVDIIRRSAADLSGA